MADCQINSVSDQQSSSDRDVSTIPEGRVGKVCKEWLIREDGNLAYQLQNEEIAQHYNENRSKNQLVRQDFPLAKNLQQNEILEAQRKYERYLQEQIDHDERMARNIEHRLFMEEMEAKKAAEEADAKLAKKLMEKERAKQIRKRIEKEKQQVEKLSAQISNEYRSIDSLNSDNIESINMQQQKTLDRYARSKNQRIMTEDEQELDLSEFCMPPPPGLNPEELKLFLEEQDAEIAQLLQNQELKRNKNPEKEKLALIEQQDYEIAKMLQKMEKERYRKIKEKLRSNRLRSNQSPSSNNSNDQDYQRTSTPLTSLESYSTAKESMNKIENDYDIPENHFQHEQTYEEPSEVLNDIAQNFHNIAIDLDPTYKRRLKQQLQLHQQSLSTQNPLRESCVDDNDNDDNAIDMDLRTEFVNKTGSPTHRSFHDNSLEKLNNSTSKMTNGLGYLRNSPSTSLSSRSSNASCNNNENKIIFNQQKSNDYAPPLPPRDMSLRNMNNFNNNNQSDNYKFNTEMIANVDKDNSSLKNRILLPHHPKHPNRQYHDLLSGMNNQSNEQSSSSSLPVPGQWRILPSPKSNQSLDKPLMKKTSNKQDGCKTQ